MHISYLMISPHHTPLSIVYYSITKPILIPIIAIEICQEEEEQDGYIARRQVRRQVRHNRQVGAYDQQPQQAAKPEQAPAPVKEEKKVIVECEFPRCEKLPEYGFKDVLLSFVSNINLTR